MGTNIPPGLCELMGLEVSSALTPICLCSGIPRKTRKHDPCSVRFPWAAPPPPHCSAFCHHRQLSFPRTSHVGVCSTYHLGLLGIFVPFINGFHIIASLWLTYHPQCGQTTMHLPIYLVMGECAMSIEDLVMGVGAMSSLRT